MGEAMDTRSKRAIERESRASMSNVMGFGSPYDLRTTERSQFALYAGSMLGLREKENFEKLRAKQEAGPGWYWNSEVKGFDGIGERKNLVLSNSCPTVRISKTGREEWQGVKISCKHRNVKEIKNSLSAGDYDFDLSTNNGKSTSVGAGARFRDKLYETPTPGPVYDVRNKHRKDISTQIIGNTGRRWAHGPRFAKTRPSDCDPKSLNRTQDAIECDFSKAVSFGVSKRSAYSKSVRPGWEEDYRGRHHPGVGPPLWSKLLHPEHHVSRFPKDTRFRTKENEVPGPGAYHDDKAHLKHISKTTKFGSPTKFPRLRLEQQDVSGFEDGCWGYN